MSVQPHPSDALVETVREIESLRQVLTQYERAMSELGWTMVNATPKAALSLLAERLKAAEQESAIREEHRQQAFRDRNDWQAKAAELADARNAAEEERDAARAKVDYWRERCFANLSAFEDAADRAGAAEARLEAATDALRAIAETADVNSDNWFMRMSEICDTAEAARAVLVGGDAPELLTGKHPRTGAEENTEALHD